VIIKDIYGGELNLTKTRLTEVSGGSTGTAKYYLKLSSLPLRKNGEITIRLTSGENPYEYNDRCNVSMDSEELSIGCREFDTDTFNQILKAARAARRKSKKKA
jgi:hypothetical protein